VGNDSGGNVTLTVGATAGDILTLYRDMPYARTQNYTNSGDFLASEVNSDFDNLWLAGEQTNRAFSQSIRKPITDSDSISMELPEATDRADRVLTFDSTGAVSTAVLAGNTPSTISRQQFTGNGSTTVFTLASDLGIGAGVVIYIDGIYQEEGTYTISGTTLTFTEAPPTNASIEVVSYKVSDIAISDASAVSYLPSGTGAVQTTVQAKLRESVSVKDFGAVGDGITDDTAAINAALVAAAGSTVYVPAGTYVVTSTLSNNLSPVEGAFGPAIRIIGDGMLRTFFDNRVANGPMIDIDSANHGGSYQAVMGSLLQGFMIKTTTNPANSDGIRILNGYEIVIEHLYIKGLTGNGIEMKNGLYVDDGWNMCKIKNSWIDSCAKWGIKADGSAGRNEGSFTHLEHVFFQSNGTASASVPPPSGGMIWKGQIMTMDQCAFANGNQNVGLFIKGESGLAQTATLRETTFENCYKKSLYVTGIAQMAVDNCQVYNNDNFIATTGMEFDGSTYTIQNIDINGVVVRATAGNNPFTAFKISGVNAEFKTCQVRNVVFDNFDYAGQVRQSGFKEISTVVARKDSAQSIFNSASAIVFNQIDKDLQDCFDTVTGRYTVSYDATFNIKGQITVTSLDADVEVAISLYDVSAAADIAKVIYNADGVTTQSFPFDFTLDLGLAGTTRSYEIRATQQSVGSKALDVSSDFYNTFTARRIPNGELEF
jgi:hypothetical protein